MSTSDTAIEESADTHSRLDALLPRTWVQLIAAVAALLFLGGSVTYFAVERADRPPAKDSVDVGFLYDMIAHHEQALQMSNAEIVNGATPGIQVFAREILLFQSYEIGLMDRKLDEWGYQRENPPDLAMSWMDMPVAHDHMPGMASEDEMDRLGGADGRQADALFIPLMQDHHAGGVHMAEYAAEHTKDPFVRDLAVRMARNQRMEIAELEGARGRAELPKEPAGYEPAIIPDGHG